MDIEQERQTFLETLGRIRDEAVRTELRSKFEELATSHGAAADKAPIEVQIAELQQQAAAAAEAAGGGGGAGGQQGGGSGGGNGGSAPQNLLTKGGYGMVLFVTLLIFLFLALYFWELGGDRFTSPGAIRPLLVLTLIACMLGFGGLLIVRALFAPGNTPLQERFRMAREIFLVFSGIFGTIIGFYFGAADDDEVGKALALEISVAAERQLTVEVEGGTEPYRGILTLENDPVGMSLLSRERNLTFSPPATVCPRSADIFVTDSRGRVGETEVAQSNAELREAGWTACPETTEPDNGSNPATENDTEPGEGKQETAEDSNTNR